MADYEIGEQRMRNRDIVFKLGIVAFALAWFHSTPAASHSLPILARPSDTSLQSAPIIGDSLGRMLALDPEYGFSLEGLIRNVDLVRRETAESVEISGYVIIVDKAAYKLFLMKNGSVQNEFKIELGFDPIHDKIKQGDCRTPEGFYEVLYPQEGPQTRFHKALTINYPNASDLRDFDELKRSGQVGELDSVGGEIQIHGAGGRGRNWTLGCIALSNEDMDRLFPLAKARGTPILIVKYGAEYALKR
jgi:hypothetical protein